MPYLSDVSRPVLIQHQAYAKVYASYPCNPEQIFHFDTINMMRSPEEKR